MKMRFWAIGLMGFFLCAGCGQQDSSAQPGAVMEQEMAEPGRATRSDGAPPAVQSGQKWMRERLAGDQDSIVRKAIEDGFYDPEVRINVSGRTERDAYDEARLKAAREFENPADW